MPQYTEDYIRKYKNADWILKKYVMIVNHLHIKNQNELGVKIALHPNNDGKTKYKTEDVPYRAKPTEKEKKALSFEERRSQMWKEAPEYNDSKFKNLSNLLKR